MPRAVAATPHGERRSKCVRNPHTVLHILTCDVRGSSFLSILASTCYYQAFKKILIIQISEKVPLVVVMCVSLMRHVEHLFTCLFAIRMSSLARCPFKPLPVFFIGLLECLLLNFESSVSKSLIGDVTCK